MMFNCSSIPETNDNSNKESLFQSKFGFFLKNEMSFCPNVRPKCVTYLANVLSINMYELVYKTFTSYISFDLTEMDNNE